MAKGPSPKADALRAMREARYAEAEARRKAEAKAAADAKPKPAKRPSRKKNTT